MEFKQATTFDNLISPEMHTEVSDWCLSVQWYSGIMALEHQNDFDPRGINKLSKVVKSMWRHPIAWDNESLNQRNPVVTKLWNIINDKIFDGKATVDGIPEGISGIGMRERNIESLKKISLINKWIKTDILSHKDTDYYSDGIDFFSKYDCPRDKKEFTCYINAREATPITGHSRGGVSMNGILGSIHKDSGPDFVGKSGYYTVLYIANENWKPSWGGEYVFFDDVEDAETQWKHGYNIGYPSQIIGNKPGRIVVYPHDLTHRTQSNNDSDMPSYRICFRVKVN
jgi:hypothetical protein